MIRRGIYIIACCLGIGYANAQQTDTITNINIRDITMSDFQHLFETQEDTLYVINFWATWCVPCIKELPAFDSLHIHYAGKPVKVWLVSLDFAAARKTQLPEFIQKKKIAAPVAFMTSTNENEYIPFISEEWTGSIPATLFYHAGKREKYFVQESLNYAELEALVRQFIP